MPSKTGKFILLVAIGIVASLYVNCGGSLPHNPVTQPSLLGDPNDVNNFKEVPPAIICGKEGWAFLNRNYFHRECVACHAQGGFAPAAFADTNADVAYFAALSVTRSKWDDTLLNNKFCGAECSLTPTGQVYKGFQQWLYYQVNTSSGCP